MDKENNIVSDLYDIDEVCFLIQENSPKLELRDIRARILGLPEEHFHNLNSKELMKKLKIVKKDNSLLSRKEWDLLRTIKDYDDNLIFIGFAEDVKIMEFMKISIEQFEVMKKLKEIRNGK